MLYNVITNKGKPRRNVSVKYIENIEFNLSEFEQMLSAVNTNIFETETKPQNIDNVNRPIMDTHHFEQLQYIS